ncbi:MAG: triple tyrosine motif-containing protein [Methanobacteriota archaeon]
MKKMVVFRKALKVFFVFMIVAVFMLPSTSLSRMTSSVGGFGPGSMISVAYAEELIHENKALLLEIYEGESTLTPAIGVASVTLSQLSCESCFKNKLKSYDALIVFSTTKELRQRGIDFLIEQGFLVYELVEAPHIQGMFPLDSSSTSTEPMLTWEEYTESDAFQNGGRCLTPSREIREQLYGKQGRDQSDCSQYHTNPSEEYTPTFMYVIPVVVHIIKKTDGTGEISNAMVQSQIDILNEDYRALPGTPGQYSNESMIQFVLAKKDPDGNPTTGITRSVNNDWYNDLGHYWESLAWDPNRYLNIYTNSVQLGYCKYLPADAGGIHVGALDDRVVIYWKAFGRNAPIGPPFNQGRTATHEVGHYLGLEHTFEGDDCPAGYPPYCYSNGDLICDTASETFSHVGCPIGHQDCGHDAPIHNFMEYTDDTCMTHFTVEQVKRMRCSLAYYRINLDHSPVNVVLIHDGYGDRPANVHYYEQAIQNSGYSYYTFNLQEEGRYPSSSYLGYCDSIIWFCGSSALSYNAQTLLADYLDSWGNVFITGSYVSPLSFFEGTYLHRDGGGFSQTSMINQVYGHMDGVFNNVDFGIRGGDGADNNGFWVTCIDPADDLVDGAFNYNIDYPTDGGFAGIQVEGFHANAKHRVVYFGFTFESIDNVGDRNLVMDRALDWLVRPFSPETLVDSGPSGNIWYDDVTFTFHAVDDKTPSENIQYQHRIVGYSDTWSSWTSSTSALYTNLPFNREYRFEVRAKDDDSPENVDPTPAQQEFSVGDVVGPTVILSGPSGTISYKNVTFEWYGYDNYSPPNMLQYSYILYGYDSGWSSWSSVTTASYTNLPDGTYMFVVHGRDQALNVGPDVWTQFTVQYHPGGHGCFVAGTPIIMSDGLTKNIEDVIVGERVLAYDEASQRVRVAPVTEVFHHMPVEMGSYYLVINDDLRVTRNHPLYVNGEWKTAEDVQIGDLLFSVNGVDIPVTSIGKICEQVATYNLEIGMYHTYFADDVLVHNKPLPYELARMIGDPEGP